MIGTRIVSIWWGLAIMIGLALVELPTVRAQMPIQLKAPPTSGQGAKTPAAEKQVKQELSAEELEAQLREKLAAAEAELAEIDTPETLAKGAPPGVPDSELQERRSLLQRLASSYDLRISQTKKLEQARARHAESERNSTASQGFTDPPPYPITKVDELWNSAWVLNQTVETAQVKVKLLKEATERAQETAKTLDSRLRKAAESLESVREGPDAAKVVWAHRMAQLRARAAGSAALMLETSVKVGEEELAEVRQRLALTQRQLEIVQDQVVFNQGDLEKIQRRLDEERQALDREMDRALSAQREGARAYDSAERQLREFRDAGVKKAQTSTRTAKTKARLEENVELKQAQLDNLNLKLEMIKQLADVTMRERQLWEGRFATEREEDPVKVQEAYKHIVSTREHSKAWREYVRQQETAVQGRIGELERRILNAAQGEDFSHQRNLLEVFRERETLYRRVLDRIETYIRVLERWKSELEHRHQAMSLSTRLREWGGLLTNNVRLIWDFELFAAEDTIEVDGQQITGRRSVTVGKTIRWIVVLIVAYWGSLFLARVAQRLAVRRLRMDANLADLVRKWTLALLFSILLVASLIWVKIPLTVFAFLGGALAIGIGFGTQTMLKNFISGLLLLIERPMRIGDLIEVNGIRGVVTTIGFRSSTIRDANGMEMHVPNSTLLEQTFSNWTYSNAFSRWSLKVGVVYGSQVNRVLEILKEIVEAHPKVLKDPPPAVFFEDFGESALLFGIYYWLEFGFGFNPLLVGSELRSAIDRRFTEEGIVLAFPQRDVHLDSARPIQVQVMSERRMPSSADEASPEADEKQQNSAT